jgi:hypothetical protein
MNKLSIIKNLEQSAQDFSRILEHIQNKINTSVKNDISAIEVDLLLSKLQTMYDYSLLLKSNSNMETHEHISEKKLEIEASDISTTDLVFHETETELQKQDDEMKEMEMKLTELPKEKLSEEKANIQETKSEEKDISPSISKKEATILADTYQNQKSINETINASTNDLASKLKANPINDIKSAIGLNDRFLLTKELFDGNGNLFSTSIDAINNSENLNAAINFLSTNFAGKESLAAYIKLTELIYRRFAR